MSYKCPFCPSEELEEFEHKTNNHDIEMVREDSCEDLSDNKSTDSEINNQSFQSMMSISEVDSDSELNEEESKPEINVNYPSEAYGDLMALIIEQGRKYMDNMKLPNLNYTKTSIMNYNNNEYFLYHQSLINCIKNILSISDISQNFALTFEKVEHNGVKGSLANKILGYGGKMRKNLCHLSFSYISDWPEAATYCLTYKSPMSKHPCHFCLVTRDNLADLNLQIDDITPRTHVNMQQMHHLDLGLFHYQIDYTKKLLGAQCGKTLVDEVDHRLAAIPRFPGLKIFTNGIQSIARLTANEYRNLMKVMVFVVDNLFVNNEDDENFVKNEDLAKLYEAWNEMYAISRYEISKKVIWPNLGFGDNQ
ncbi:hypothetical protein GLOIN_2v1762814 [Rhizophagus irregularis DAOM 181602=DAOM 197198]|nr:hypothetical protein GLOIN_2v1762814 [Rhizophagus irregularis DAOM 181602=DAOM 197198]